ncbi:hypothetical protein E4U55_002068 [Claviceps digitariae]|nr:hypothetical protein E4U55_002068 [Claviceps digitariae]
MDFLKSNLASGGSNKAQPSAQQSSGGFMSRVNEAAGGGRKAEQNEDFVDKGSRHSSRRSGLLFLPVAPQYDVEEWI